MSALPFEEVSEHLQRYFGLDGKLSPLGSCEDFNYKLKTTDGRKFVVKYINPKTSYEEVAFQHQVLIHLASCKLKGSLVFPRPQKLVDSEGTIVRVITRDGRDYCMHLLTFVDGFLLADFKHLDHEVLYTFGVEIASFNESLATFPHPILPITTDWDPKRSYEICVDRAPSITDKAFRNELLSWVTHVHEKLTVHDSNLRSQLVHCDLAFYNVVCKIASNGRPNVSGVIDFGDVTKTWLVGDLAIAITPLLAHENRSVIEYTCDVVRGFVSVTKLSEVELECLWYIIILRSILLCISVLHLIAENPENQYLVDEIVENEKIVRKILQVPIQYAITAIKQAAGLNVDVKANAWSELLHPLFVNAPNTKTHLLDLSIASLSLYGGSWLGEHALKQLIDDQLKKVHHSSHEHFVLPLGSIWLTRTKVRSLEAPRTIPTFHTVFVEDGLSLQAPIDCELKVHSKEEARQRWGEGEIPEELFGNADYSVAELQWNTNHLLLLGLEVTTASQTLKAGDVFARVPNTSGLQKAPLLIQFVSYKSYSFGPYIQPPLFCNENDWKIWEPYVWFDLNTLLPEQALPVLSSTNLIGEEKKVLQQRYDNLAGCQEHYFRHPPQIERGYKQYMYDIYGRAYLDMVNNVAVVGHGHPALAQAAYNQGIVLNTNSRFLYGALSSYSEQVLQTIPASIRAQGKLNRIFLVNSGSEATDLAMRIGRTVASERRIKKENEAKGIAPEDSVFHLQRDTICITGGYHGVTIASDEVSTTLNDNPRSLETRAPWIHLVPMPNTYRGKVRLPRFSNPDEETLKDVATKYADMVREKVADLVAKGTPPSVFIAEPLSGNAGGVTIPPTYLTQVYECIREVGGLCICDEVQVGYGRLGNVFWCFEEHDIVPDIITMAKGAGNGHPLGFVITSEEIAKEFQASQGSFFSSAGGGPISCTIGSTVLRLIDEEKLQENALVVGNYMHEQLLQLQQKHPHLIGRIHGHGLYQGIEIVRGKVGMDRNSVEVPPPATEECYAICERLLELGVICHNTGDYSNVLKVKPPLCITKEDVDFVVQALDITLTGW